MRVFTLIFFLSREFYLIFGRHCLIILIIYQLFIWFDVCDVVKRKKLQSFGVKEEKMRRFSHRVNWTQYYRELCMMRRVIIFVLHTMITKVPSPMSQNSSYLRLMITHYTSNWFFAISPQFQCLSFLCIFYVTFSQFLCNIYVIPMQLQCNLHTTAARYLRAFALFTWLLMPFSFVTNWVIVWVQKLRMK